MMSEIGDAAQIISATMGGTAQIVRISIDGIQVAFRLSGALAKASVELLKKFLALIGYMLWAERPRNFFVKKGKTALHRMLHKGGELEVFSFRSEDMKKVNKLCKQCGVIYSVMPDLNKVDGMTEIMFHAEDIPKMNLIAKKLTDARIEGVMDYLQNGIDEKKMAKMTDFLAEKMEKGEIESEELKNAKIAADDLFQRIANYCKNKNANARVTLSEIKRTFGISSGKAKEILQKMVDFGLVKETGDGVRKRYHVRKFNDATPEFDKHMERYRQYFELANRPPAFMMPENDSISINMETLLKEETDDLYVTRVPGTFGQNARYLSLEKSECVIIDDGKTILTALSPENDYVLYDANNVQAGTVKGKELAEHYNDVSEQRMQAAERIKDIRQEKRRTDMLEKHGHGNADREGMKTGEKSKKPEMPHRKRPDRAEKVKVR